MRAPQVQLNYRCRQNPKNFELNFDAKNKLILEEVTNCINDLNSNMKELAKKISDNIDEGIDSKETIKLVAKERNVKKSEVYDLYLKLFRK